MLSNRTKDALTSIYITGTVIFGLSFGYHNIHNGNLYVNSIRNTNNDDRSCIRHKRLLDATSVAKGMVYGLFWPISSPIYYFRKDKLPMICPMYHDNNYQRFYNHCNDITTPY